MKELFKRNYDAVVRRGLINEETLDFGFWSKLNEENNEVYQQCLIVTRNLITCEHRKENLNEEIADCLVVCANWLIYRGVDLEEILTKIAEKNEKRANSI